MSTDRETRERLLEAAERLFAERGFKDVTVRDICRAARANVAAVNYHFGDKLALYSEILRRAASLLREATAAAEHAGAGRPAEERLRLSIHAFLSRVLVPQRQALHRVVDREMRNPTPALDTLIDDGVRPRIEHLAGIVAELMEVPTTDSRVLRCVGSIQSQSVMYLPNPVAVRLGFTFEPTAARIEAAARHIADFSLAGIRAVARQPAAAAPRAEGSLRGASPRRSRTPVHRRA